MTEKQFENRVKTFLKAEGCWVLKTWGGGYQRSGIPDLLFCCNGKFCGVELKSEDGRPSLLQIHEVEQIQKAGGYGCILFPSGFEDFKKRIKEIKDGIFLFKS